MSGFILDKPEQIQAFAYLQVFHKLKLEVKYPTGPKWRVSPAKQAKQIMANHGKVVNSRSKKVILLEYEAFLIDAEIFIIEKTA